MPDCAVAGTGRQLGIGFEADAAVAEALARIGRTEDLKFAPGGDSIALAGLTNNRILIIGVERGDGGTPAVRLAGFAEIESPALAAPHGVAWLDDRTLIVANRKAGLAVFELPPGALPSERLMLEPARLIGADRLDLVRTPGSVAVAPLGLGLYDLLVCNNYVHHVSRLLIDGRDRYSVVASERLLDEGLAVPDGVALSPCGRWVAISNHDARGVWIYRDDGRLGPGSRPEAVLRGISYPHGLRFADGGRSLLVADAGAPCVRLFRSADGRWSGERLPDQSIRVLGDSEFERGSYDPQEGGPKGLDVEGRLLAVTCEQQPLALFDLSPVLGAGGGAGSDDAAGSAERARARLLQALATARFGLAEATEAIRRTSERELAMLMSSRSWRLTAPLRWLADRRRRRRRRSG